MCNLVFIPSLYDIPYASYARKSKQNGRNSEVHADQSFHATLIKADVYVRICRVAGFDELYHTHYLGVVINLYVLDKH